MSKNIAVIGGGYWGKNLVRNFAELGALHAICDVDPATLEHFKALYPGAQTQTDYQKVLADPAVRGVVIAAPAVLHYAMARDALIADKDVFVEKPLALRVKEGEELVKLAAAKGKIIQVGHLLVYHPAVVKLKEMVDSGDLGKINYVYSNRLNLGKLRTEENVLWSFAPHDISVMLFLLGEVPEEISAHGGNYLHRDIADVTMTTLGFRGGLKAHIFVSWLHPFKEQKLVVVGDKKMAVFDDTSPDNKLALYSHEIEWVDRRPIPRPAKPQPVKVSSEEPLRLECQDFIECLRSRRLPKVDGCKGLQVLEILSYCQRSLEENGRVINLNRGSNGYFVHESSLVEGPCQIDDGTKIWHFSHVMPEVKIGRNCVIGQNVFIGKNVKIGSEVKIENNVSVFEGVSLEDGVFCGPSCVFTNVHNPRSRISRKNELRPTLVKTGATIGANTTIVCGNTVGSHAFVGAGAVVTRDVPDYAMVYGNPARRQGWVCECGVKLSFAEEATTKCAACGKAYKKFEAGKETLVKRLEL